MVEKLDKLYEILIRNNALRYAQDIEFIKQHLDDVKSVHSLIVYCDIRALGDVYIEDVPQNEWWHLLTDIKKDAKVLFYRLKVKDYPNLEENLKENVGLLYDTIFKINDQKLLDKVKAIKENLMNVKKVFELVKMTEWLVNRNVGEFSCKYGDWWSFLRELELEANIWHQKLTDERISKPEVKNDNRQEDDVEMLEKDFLTNEIYLLKDKATIVTSEEIKKLVFNKYKDRCIEHVGNRDNGIKIIIIGLVVAICGVSISYQTIRLIICLIGAILVYYGIGECFSLPFYAKLNKVLKMIEYNNSPLLCYRGKISKLYTYEETILDELGTKSSSYKPHYVILKGAIVLEISKEQYFELKEERAKEINIYFYEEFLTDYNVGMAEIEIIDSVYKRKRYL